MMYRTAASLLSAALLLATGCVESNSGNAPEGSRDPVTTQPSTTEAGAGSNAAGSATANASGDTATPEAGDQAQAPAQTPTTPAAQTPASGEPVADASPLPEGPEHVDMALLRGSKYVLLQTSEGDIVLELEPEKAPISTANFLQYVRDDFYEGTIFHRVISNFMIQGGGFTEQYYEFEPTRTMTSIPTDVEKENRDPIPNEASKSKLTNNRYTISYARTNDPNSATSQFFINVVNNAGLNPGVRSPEDAGYAVFGHVIAGFDTVEAIRNTPVQRDRLSGAPSEPVSPVVITGAEIITPERAQELVGESNS